MLSLSDARSAVIDLVEPTADPVLTTTNGGDIDKALTRTAIASVWVLNTAYTVGQRVVPSVQNGRVYICTLAGTSGTTEPSWLIAPRYAGSVNPIGPWWGIGPGLPVDVSASAWLWGLADNTCAWQDDGAFAGEIYDTQAAAAECWMVKSRRAANRIDSAISGAVSARESQLAQQCLQMARSLRPVRVV
jgi:hypothetical protein